ncbi:Oxidoreductase [Cavenderia fasciculata]|uniref:Oxidoreductase n=1 Tax=Cavenderia fasciculata TaxID=261658 RepID=F4PX47_CACFS|nr:Oxidoreductase [Cavenderia fasciculata]EGG19850.1 Oxidoreductase [Cavenderia fasciculata]|eukprot:XP_004358196.1 Oxidoreductase [Cavenderia fasciculata]
MNKVVVITGASSGIGRSLALTFHNYGFKVFATSRNIERMNDMLEMGIKVLELDVTSQDSIEQTIKGIVEVEGRIDILINNAGITMFGPAIEVPMIDLRTLFEVNFFGLIATTNQVAPHMINARKGIIINIGSVAAWNGMPFGSSYSSSKAALHNWSDALRMELDPFNIKVITIAPGPISTGIIEKATPLLDHIMERSVYRAIASDINNRPQMSKSRQVPVQSFADFVLSTIFSRRIPANAAFGPGSVILRFLSYLPTWLSDYILKKQFGLAKLKSIIQKADKDNRPSNPVDLSNNNNNNNFNQPDIVEVGKEQSTE